MWASVPIDHRMPCPPAAMHRILPPNEEDADDVVLERLLFLRNEVDYLQRERDQVRSVPEYQENIGRRKA